jgi:hypothetical protein
MASLLPTAHAMGGQGSQIHGQRHLTMRSNHTDSQPITNHLPAVLALQIPIEYRLINKRDPSISICTALLLEILYPWYILIAILGGLFRKQW